VLQPAVGPLRQTVLVQARHDRAGGSRRCDGQQDRKLVAAPARECRKRNEAERRYRPPDRHRSNDAERATMM